MKIQHDHDIQILYQTNFVYIFIIFIYIYVLPFQVCFHKTVGTNNDMESWHRRLNSKAGRGQLDLYLLIQLLGEEAALVTIQLDLLQMCVVTRRRRSQRITGRLFSLWDQLQNKESTPRRLLRAASHLIPVPQKILLT